MPQWEYKVFKVQWSIWIFSHTLKIDGKLLHEKINELGSEGWELIPPLLEDQDVFTRSHKLVGAPPHGGRWARITHLKCITFKRPLRF